MGVVYLAFGPDKLPVALKVLQPALAHDEDYRVRFIREVSAARLVDSPYVARVVMAAETESEPLWMATEYVEGATLAHAVEANGPRSPRPSPRVGVRSGERRLALHDAGLVHRDLKPANVVLAWSGPKLDRLRHRQARRRHRPDPERGHGGFAAVDEPEVLNGHQAARSSDVFAWGLCVAFAGTGRPPFGPAIPPRWRTGSRASSLTLGGLPPICRDWSPAAWRRSRTPGRLRAT